MAKLIIAASSFLGAAVVSALSSNGYTSATSADVTGTLGFILVDTTAKTCKDSATAGSTVGRTTLNAATQWAAVEAALSGRALVAAAAPRVAATPAPAAISSSRVRGRDGQYISVGDTVRAYNKDNTKRRFRLDTNQDYRVTEITASGKVYLNNSTGDAYVADRFRRVTASSTAAVDVDLTVRNAGGATVNANVSVNGGARVTLGARTAGSLASASRVAAPAAKPAVDAAGNTLRVGDYVEVLVARGKKTAFNLPLGQIRAIARITASGAIGFAGYPNDEYLANRFQKVTLAPATLSSGSGFHRVIGNLVSGAKVLCTRDSRAGSRFNLPKDKALTFRGVTVEGNKLILDGYTADQYSVDRFSVITRVGTVRR